ncbi:sigma 54-interacting transcriptional regulator [Desulfotruncus alcoholivorax]|uniref:sigma 54-interacting transcriptional regulator n=1 Tax=Desulfotruncus alcoholivorax TaxID=265477 RepID=UPI000416D265|nr:sigma 54-interacting transcriptional regulator [Desulfotruncus alcoholivorax]
MFIKSLVESQSLLNPVLARGQLYEINAGETLTVESTETDKKFFFLLSGRLQLSYSDRDNPGIVLTVIEPGEPIIETAFGFSETAGFQLIALEQVKAVALSQEDFLELFKLSMDFSHDLINSLSQRLQESYQKVWDARKRESVYARLLTEEKRNKHVELAGNHQAMKQARQHIADMAINNEPVYLVGEKGTGKELLAWLIHQAGPRSRQPFIVVECSEMIEDDLGERLFGSMNSFPQAGGLFRFGYLELALGGSLLLKDVDRLGPLVMIRLAAFLENNFMDVRIMATSQEPLSPQFLDNELEAEVLTRLFSNPVVLPPLRDRMRDLPLLTKSILAKLAKKHDCPVPILNREAQEKLLTYKYTQANVAELEEILERAMVLADGEVIAAEHVFTGIVADTSGVALNLLQYNSVKQLIKKEFYPRLPQLALSVGLLIFIAAAFLDSQNLLGSVVLLSAWSLGWPLLLLSAALAGRLTCSICPFAGTASIGQSLKSLNRPIPQFVKKYDYIIISFLFASIFWVEEISDMRHSPVATGLLLLTITLGAVTAAILYPRHTWCRHLCPLGGMVSICSMGAPVELRSNVDICRHKCTTYNCYKGTGQHQGCPLFQHLSFVDNNVACKLCLKCVLNCPNDAIRLNIRPPAREIWQTSHINRGLAVFVLVFASLLIPIGYYEKRGINIPQNIAGFSAFYWGTVCLAAFAVWFLIRKRLNSEDSLPFIRSFFCLVPLVWGAHFAYQLQFVPMLPNLQLYLHHLMPDVSEKQLILISLLGLLRILILTGSFMLTLVCLLFVRKDLKGKEKNLFVTITTLSVFYTGVMFLLLVER